MKLTCEEFTTVTSEVEVIVNSCPHTYIYEDEVEEILTKSHLSRWRWLLDKQSNKPRNEDITEINTIENLAKIIERFLENGRKSMWLS